MAGDFDLKIPKLRVGSFFPALLERRRRVDQALFAVVMEAYVHGISTRKVDNLVKASGADTGISKPEVSRICAGLDAEVAEFRDRTLAAQDFPYVFLDATYCKACVGHRIVCQAVGLAADRRREVLGVDNGDSENGGFWTSFLRSLKTRGLDGVKLVMSDVYTGLEEAIGTVFQGAGWQCCRVHFMARPSPWCQRDRRRWSPRSSAISSTSPTVSTSRSSSMRSLRCSAVPTLRSRRYSSTPNPTCSSSRVFRGAIGARSGPQTR